MDNSEQEKYIQETKVMFRSFTDKELVESFNGQLGNSGWGWARSIYIGTMLKEFRIRNWDYSVITSESGGIKLAHGNEIYLLNEKFHLLRKAQNTNTLKSISMTKTEIKEILEIKSLELINEKTKNKLLSKVEPDTQVIVHCHFTALNGDKRIRIWQSTFLYASGSIQKSKLVFADNINMYPVWTIVKNGETLNFTLIFTSLPKGCMLFNMIENIPEPGGFDFKNIKRNDSDVYRINFS